MVTKCYYCHLVNCVLCILCQSLFHVMGQLVCIWSDFRSLFCEVQKTLRRIVCILSLNLQMMTISLAKFPSITFQYRILLALAIQLIYLPWQNYYPVESIQLYNGSHWRTCVHMICLWPQEGKNRIIIVVRIKSGQLLHFHAANLYVCTFPYIKRYYFSWK